MFFNYFSVQVIIEAFCLSRLVTHPRPRLIFNQSINQSIFTSGTGPMTLTLTLTHLDSIYRRTGVSFKASCSFFNWNIGYKNRLL